MIILWYVIPYLIAWLWWDRQETWRGCEMWKRSQTMDVTIKACVVTFKPWKESTFRIILLYLPLPHVESRCSNRQYYKPLFHTLCTIRIDWNDGVSRLNDACFTLIPCPLKTVLHIVICYMLITEVIMSAGDFYCSALIYNYNTV